MGAKRVTPQEIDTMYRLYSELGTYAAVGEKMHRAPSTVSKYLKARGLKPLSMSVAAHVVKES